MPRKKLESQAVTKPATPIKRGPGRPATKNTFKTAVKQTKAATKKTTAKKTIIKAIGKAVPKNAAKNAARKANGQLNFELPIAAHEAFKQHAAERGTSMTEILKKFVLKTVKMAA